MSNGDTCTYRLHSFRLDNRILARLIFWAFDYYTLSIHISFVFLLCQ